MFILGKKQRTRRRPQDLSARRDSNAYTDYYRSESKRVMDNKQKGKQGGVASRRVKVSANAKHLPIIISVVAILLSLIYSSVLNNNVLIVVPASQGLLDRGHYESVAKSVMKRSIFNKSKFTFNTRQFKEDLQKEMPEIKDVTISVPLVGNKPVAGVTFVRPLYVFSVSGDDYIVGENGVLLANANDVSSEKKNQLHSITDEAPLEVSVGKPVLLSSDIKFIDTMYKALEAAGIQVGSAKLPLGAGELHVQPAGQKYVIKFLLSGDATQQVGAYIATTKYNQASAVPNEYVDVRLAERVFIK